VDDFVHLRAQARVFLSEAFAEKFLVESEAISRYNLQTTVEG
jgi:hypothetical protein